MAQNISAIQETSLPYGRGAVGCEVWFGKLLETWGWKLGSVNLGIGGTSVEYNAKQSLLPKLPFSPVELIPSI